MCSKDWIGLDDTLAWNCTSQTPLQTFEKVILRITFTRKRCFVQSHLPNDFFLSTHLRQNAKLTLSDRYRGMWRVLGFCSAQALLLPR
jgi:hypothetical protein